MKITTLLAAAGIALASFGAAAPADAQPSRHDSRFDRDHRGDRGRGSYRQRNNRRHYSQRGRGRNRHCRIVRRHGQRQRVCR